MPELDPDVPILWNMLDGLRAAVAAGGITQDVASEILGKQADSLVARRKGEKPNPNSFAHPQDYSRALNRWRDAQG
jgi:hypothetical protein